MVVFLLILGILAVLAPVAFNTNSYPLPEEVKDLTSYGKWCGYGRPGIYPWDKHGRFYGCSCEESLDTCLVKRHSYDALDRACAVHEYCMRCGGSPVFKKTTGKTMMALGLKPEADLTWCRCERILVHMAELAECVDKVCSKHRENLLLAYKKMPCYCRWMGKTCNKPGTNEMQFCMARNYTGCPVDLREVDN